jgi:transporter family-2 protein
MKLALIPLLTGIIAGISMALQGSLNTLLSKVIGLLEAAFVVHVIGAVALVALLLMRLGQGNLAQMGKAPGMLILVAY